MNNKKIVIGYELDETRKVLASLPEGVKFAFENHGQTQSVDVFLSVGDCVRELDLKGSISEILHEDTRVFLCSSSQTFNEISDAAADLELDIAREEGELEVGHYCGPEELEISWVYSFKNNEFSATVTRQGEEIETFSFQATQIDGHNPYCACNEGHAMADEQRMERLTSDAFKRHWSDEGRRRMIEKALAEMQETARQARHDDHVSDWKRVGQSKRKDGVMIDVSYSPARRLYMVQVSNPYQTLEAAFHAVGDHSSFGDHKKARKIANSLSERLKQRPTHVPFGGQPYAHHRPGA